MKLRHIGVLVKNLENSVETYKAMGFNPVGKEESFRVRKMSDPEGRVIELIQGEYHNHVAVNWLTDEDGNWIELVEVKE